jgi:hypothetical protein
MHTTCFDQHCSSAGISKISDEIAVLPFVNSIFGTCPRVCTHVPYVAVINDTPKMNLWTEAQQFRQQFWKHLKMINVGRNM